MADSMRLRGFLGLPLDKNPPDHSTLSRTRRLIDLEVHQQVFTWVLAVLVKAGLVKGRTVGIDATTLEANAAMRSIVRRLDGQAYEDYLTSLAKASGIETPTRQDLAKLDRKRPKKGSKIISSSSPRLGLAHRNSLNMLPTLSCRPLRARRARRSDLTAARR